MVLSCSSGVRCEFPEVESVVNDVKRVARSFDRGIKVRGLLIEMRLSPIDNSFNGWAHPERFSYLRNQLRWHHNGRVQISIGSKCGYQDMVRVLAHELRHIGQFNRGKDRYGILTIDPLSPNESEDDAYEFEEKILCLV